MESPPNRPFIVAGESTAEALSLACLLCSGAGSPTDVSGVGALVFDTPDSLQRFHASKSAPRIAIIHTAEVERQISDLYQSCHCIIARPTHDIATNPDIRLGLPSASVFDKALKKVGICSEQIDLLARQTGRSPTVLRRRLSNIPAIREPAWSRDHQIARKLMPAAFVGTWRKDSAADRSVLQTLAGAEDYDEVERAVLELHAQIESPLWSTGEFRGVTSRIDALFGIARFVTKGDIERFLAVASTVLGEQDPAVELPEHERWTAGIQGKVRARSEVLRQGIRDTLVLMAIYGNDLFQSRIGGEFEMRTSLLIKELLTPLTLQGLL